MEGSWPPSLRHNVPLPRREEDRGKPPSTPSLSGPEGGGRLPACSCVAPAVTCLDNVEDGRAKNMQDRRAVRRVAPASAGPGWPVGDVDGKCAHTDTTELAQTTPAPHGLVALPSCGIHDLGLMGSVQERCTPMQQT